MPAGFIRTPCETRLERKDEEYGRDVRSMVVDCHADTFENQHKAHSQRHYDKQSPAADNIYHIPLNKISNLILKQVKKVAETYSQE